MLIWWDMNRISTMAKNAQEEGSNDWMPEYPLTEEEEALCLQLEQKFDAVSTSNIDYMMPLMTVIQNIFKSSSLESTNQSVPETGFQGLEEMESPVRYTIYRLTWLIISCKDDCGTPPSDQDIMMHFHEDLCSYTWESKVILILAAFAMMYGDFFLTVVEKQTNASPLAKNLRTLKQPHILQAPNSLSPQFEHLSTLMTKMVDLANVVINFHANLKHKNIPISTVDTFKITSVVHMVTCKFIKIMLSCSAFYTRLLQRDILYANYNTASETETYQYLIQDLERVNLTTFLKFGAYKQVEEIFHAGPVEISDLISKLFPAPNSLVGKPGENCLEIIKGKVVALLITDMNVKVETLACIQKNYDHKKKGFAVIWIPLVDSSVALTQEDEDNLSIIAEQMPWFWCPPSKLPPSFSAYAMKEWKCETRTAMVVFNSRAKLLNPNAFPVLQVFRPAPFPYSKDVAEVLFIQKKLSMEALISGFLNLNMKNKIVCLCGGDDVFLLYDFFASVQKINQTTVDCVLPVFIGTNVKHDRFQHIWKTFSFGGICLSKSEISTFWSSVQYVCQMRMEYYKNGDEISEQLATLLSYNTEGLWATLVYDGQICFSRLTGQELIDDFTSFGAVERGVPIQGIGDVWNYLCHDLNLEKKD